MERLWIPHLDSVVAEHARMKWLRRIIATIIVLLVAALLLRLTMPYWLPYLAKRLEPWIKTQLETVAAAYVHPTLSIESIEYEWPLTIRVNNAKMASINPASGEMVDLVSVGSATIVLREIPSAGKPLVFQDFILESPSIGLHVLADGRIVGWEDFLKDPESVPPDLKATDIFKIDVIDVRQFSFVYAVEDNPDVMVLDQLDFKLDNRARDAAKDVSLLQGPGWYAIDTTLNKEGLFALDFSGALSFNTLDGVIENLALKGEITPEAIKQLPPQLQELMREYDIAGKLDAKVHGSFNLNDISSSATKLHLALGTSHFAIQERLVHVKSATADFRFDDKIFSTDNGIVTLESGEIGMTMRLEVADSADPTLPKVDTTQQETILSKAKGLLPEVALRKATEQANAFELTLELTPKDIPIQQFHRAGEDKSTYSGTMSGSVDLNMNLGAVSTSLLGAGTVSLTNGHFEKNPMMRGLATIMSLATFGIGFDDRAEAKFSISEETVTLSSFSVLAKPLGVRGDGWIKFNDTLHLRINAGPLEAIQESTGDLGKFLGALTDFLVKYVVTGSIEDPKISIAPLGIGS
jgi:hypothetical protein